LRTDGFSALPAVCSCLPPDEINAEEIKMLSLKSTLRFGVAAAGLTLAIGAAPSGALAQQQFISIGTGGVTGV